MWWTWPFGVLVVGSERLVLGLSFLPITQRHLLLRSDVRSLGRERFRMAGTGVRFTTAGGTPDGWVFYAVDQQKLFRSLEAHGWDVEPTPPEATRR